MPDDAFLLPTDRSGVRTAQAVVADDLRRTILSGQLRAGTRLRQDVIAANLGVSTTPVREALRELASEGLVDLDTHRGATVHRIDQAEVAEVYRLRILLEPALIDATVAEITADELRAAERLLLEMEGLTDAAQWVLLNKKFHALLADAARMPIWASVLRRLRDLSATYIGMSLRANEKRMAAGNAEHRQLLEACQCRDVGAAQEAELHHLESTLQLTGRLDLLQSVRKAPSRQSSDGTASSRRRTTKAIQRP